MGTVSGGKEKEDGLLSTAPERINHIGSRIRQPEIKPDILILYTIPNCPSTLTDDPASTSQGSRG
jgi:hypothetical protein